MQSQLREPPPCVCGWCLPRHARMPSKPGQRAGSCITVAMCTIVTECSADPCRLKGADLTLMFNSRPLKDVKFITLCRSVLCPWCFASPPYWLFETLLQYSKQVTLINHCSTYQVCLQACNCICKYALLIDRQKYNRNYFNVLMSFQN